MKEKLKLLAILFLITACDNRPLDSCRLEVNWRVNQTLRAELFDKCLLRASEARKSVNYTTNDDEDYDEVVSQCGNQAYLISRYCIYEKEGVAK